MKYKEMDVNEIIQNLIATYRNHCQLKIESRAFRPVLKNLEQRDIVWSDVWFAAGIRVEKMEEIYDEEYQKYRDKQRKKASLES